MTGRRHRPETIERMRAAYMARALGLPEQGPEPKIDIDKLKCSVCGSEIYPWAKYCSRKCYWKSLVGKAPWNKGRTAPGIAAAKRAWWATRTTEERRAVSNKRVATMRGGQ